MDPIVKIETAWHNEPATGEPCTACGEPIYSMVIVLVVSVNDKVVNQTTRVCNSCLELIIKNGI